jgi:hypothetical protein
MLTYLKELHLNLKKVIHFTDGADSQYQNFKKFINLLHHKQDFNLDGEWHFFATSHGKGPFDGIGGTLKRLALRANLQIAATIQTPQALFQWCESNVKNIKCFFVSATEITVNKKQLWLGFQISKPYQAHNPIILSYHMKNLKLKQKPILLVNSQRNLS